MRGSEKTTSIISANAHTASEQGVDVRPSLDAVAAAVCASIVSRGRRGRALPIDPPSKRRVDQLLADEAARFHLVMLGGGA